MRWRICRSTGKYFALANSAPVTLGLKPSGIKTRCRTNGTGFFCVRAQTYGLAIQIDNKLRWRYAQTTTDKTVLPRSSNGSGSRFFNPQIGVRFSYGVLEAVSKTVAGPVLKCPRNIFRVEVQLEARLFWEQEGFGSTPRYPTLIEVVEGWSPEFG